MAGPFNNYVMQTPQSLAAGTQRKTTILARRRPITAGLVKTFLGGYDGYVDYNGQQVGFRTATTPNQLDKYTRNVLQTLYAQEAYLGFTIANQVSGVNTGLDNISGDIRTGLGLASDSIKEALKPVSSALGSTLGTLTNILRDPVGSISQLPQTATDLIRNVSPEFANDLEGFFTTQNVKGLSNLPGQVLGSVRNLVTIADAALTLPFVLLSDLYNGLLEIMDEIAKFVDEVISSVISFFWGILFGEDGLLPINDFLEFLQAVVDLASEIQLLTTSFLGPNVVAGYALQIQSLATNIESYLNNPINALFAFTPTSITQPISQSLYYLRNPEAFIQNIIPPELNQLLNQVGTAIGVGWSGNAGYGLQTILNRLRGGVISSILNNYSQQFPMLGPLVGSIGPTGPGGIGTAGGSYPPSLNTFPGNPRVVVDSQGVPQLQQMPSRVFSPSADRLAGAARVV